MNYSCNYKNSCKFAASTSVDSLNMEKLTAKEEEVLGLFWEKGPLYV